MVFNKNFTPAAEKIEYDSKYDEGFNEKIQWAVDDILDAMADGKKDYLQNQTLKEYFDDYYMKAIRDENRFGEESLEHYWVYICEELQAALCEEYTQLVNQKLIEETGKDFQTIYEELA